MGLLLFGIAVPVVVLNTGTVGALAYHPFDFYPQDGNRGGFIYFFFPGCYLYLFVTYLF